MKRFVFIMALCAMSIVSCQREFVEYSTFMLSEETRNDSRIVGGEDTPAIQPGVTSVGERKTNPYNVSVMATALNAIKAEYSDVMYINLNTSDITTTHYHVMFTPQTETQLNHILEHFEPLGVEFFDYPVDAEISGEGEINPNATSVLPIYACIDKDMYISPIYTHQIIDTLYFPDENYDGATMCNAGGVSKDVIDLLVDEAFEMTGNDSEDDTRSSSDWYPSGRIIAWDDLVGDYIPVEGVKVRASRFGKTATAITDESGTFAMSKRFKKAVNYTIIWEGDEWDIRNGTIGQAKLHKDGKIKGEWVCAIKNGKQEAYACLQNALRYHFYEDTHGLDRVVGNKKIKISYLHKADTENYYGGYFTPNALGGIKNDIVIYGFNGYNNMEFSTEKKVAYIFHELGHASLYYSVGRNNYLAKHRLFREGWADLNMWIRTYNFYCKYNKGDLIRKTISMTTGTPPFVITHIFEEPIEYNRQDYNITDDGVVYMPILIDLFDQMNQQYYYKLIHPNSDIYLKYPNDIIHIYETNSNINLIKTVIYTTETINDFKQGMNTILPSLQKSPLVLDWPSALNNYLSIYE